MLIRKKYERLIHLETYNPKLKFENIKVGVEIENEVTLKAEDAKGKVAEIKAKGLVLGNIAKSIVDEETEKIIEGLKQEVKDVAQSTTV